MPYGKQPGKIQGYMLMNGRWQAHFWFKQNSARRERPLVPADPHPNPSTKTKPYYVKPAGLHPGRDFFPKAVFAFVFPSFPTPWAGRLWGISEAKNLEPFHERVPLARTP